MIVIMTIIIRLMMKFFLLVLLHLSLATASMKACKKYHYQDQATLWQGTTVAKQAADTPYSYTYNYPRAFSATYKRSLAFGGVSFTVNFYISFTASLSLVGASSDQIYFNIQDDLIIYYISFHILLVDTTSNWFFIDDYCTFL